MTSKGAPKYTKRMKMPTLDFVINSTWLKADVLFTRGPHKSPSNNFSRKIISDFGIKKCKQRHSRRHTDL